MDIRKMKLLAITSLLFCLTANAQQVELTWHFQAITVAGNNYDAMKVNADITQGKQFTRFEGALYSKVTGVGIPVFGSCMTGATYLCSGVTDFGAVRFQIAATTKNGAITVMPDLSNGKVMTLTNLKHL